MSSKPNVDIEHLSRLARLELTEAEKGSFSRQLPEIVAWFDKLLEVDVEGIEPFAHPFEQSAAPREDLAGKPWAVERLEEMAPQHRNQQVVVPKVVEEA